MIENENQEFLELFKDEATERLNNMVVSLLAVEAGRAGPDTVDALFRDAHTIKGGASMLDLDDVRELSHAVEDLLEEVRERGEFPLGLVDTLLRAVDTLRRQLTGDEDEGALDLLAELAERRRSLVARTPAVVGEDDRDVPDPEGAPSERRAIRVAPEKLDRLLDLVGESVIHQRRLEHVLGGERTVGDQAVSDELDVGERLLTDLKDSAIGMRTLPLSSITGPLPRAVRDLALAEGKEAELHVSGLDTELDRLILERLSEPLIHLVRNAVAHGIETPAERERAGKPATGSIELRALQHGGSVEIVVADDGRGVSDAVLVEARSGGSLTDVLTRPGFSTAGEVTELSGRGVGLDVVQRHVRAVGGSLEIRSEPGRGTEAVMHLPLALALVQVLFVERGGNVYAIPLSSVEEAVTVAEPMMLEGRTSLEVRGRVVPLADLADVIGAAAPAPAPRAPALVITASGRTIALLCDRLLGEDEVVVKPLGPLLARLDGYLGGAIRGDGRVALLLDPTALARSVARRRHRAAVADTGPAETRTPKVLVVEDSFTVRELQRSILEAAGYRVETARDGREGLDRLLADDEIGLVLTDVEMPELDGFALTRAIRADPRRGSTPVVILTSRGDDDDRHRGLEAGADAYMVKRSFDQQALLDTVERLVGR